MSVLETIKAHPYLMGGAALGTVVIVLMFTGKGTASGGQLVSAGASNESAYAAAQAQVASAQIAADARRSDVQAQIDIAHLASETQVRISEIDAASKYNEDSLSAQVANNTTFAQRDVALANIDAGKVVRQDELATERFNRSQDAAEQIAQYNASVAINQQTTTAMVRTQEIQSNERIATVTLANETARHEIDSNQALQWHAIDSQTAVGLDANAKSVEVARINADTEVYRGETQRALQQEADSYGIELARINNSGAVQVAQQQNSGGGFLSWLFG